MGEQRKQLIDSLMAERHAIKLFLNTQYPVLSPRTITAMMELRRNISAELKSLNEG